MIGTIKLWLMTYVSHSKLMVTLKKYWNEGQILHWIEAFLKNLQMRVDVHDSFSDWAEVLSGGPQGSVLGPLLFLIFVNDILDWIRTNVRMFADDTKIWTRIRNTEDSRIFQEDLNRLTDWSKEWLLTFNQDKCKVMYIGHDIDTRYKMSIKGRCWTLDKITEEKDLGVHTTSNLRPSRQCIKSACIKSAEMAMSVLGMIKRSFGMVNCEDFMLLYKTYVRQHLEFCIQAW